MTAHMGRLIMARRRNSKGYCDERNIEVVELNLCDYFQSKRKNNKPLCRNCTHFHVIEVPVKDSSPQAFEQNQRKEE